LTAAAVKNGDGWDTLSHKGGIGLPTIGAFLEVVSVTDVLETHKIVPTVLVLTVAVGVIAVLGEVPLDFAELAGVLLCAHVPCEAMMRGVA